jgi:hypothetical protein
MVLVSHIVIPGHNKVVTWGLSFSKSGPFHDKIQNNPSINNNGTEMLPFTRIEIFIKLRRFTQEPMEKGPSVLQTELLGVCPEIVEVFRSTPWKISVKVLHDIFDDRRVILNIWRIFQGKDLRFWSRVLRKGRRRPSCRVPGLVDGKRTWCSALHIFSRKNGAGIVCRETWFFSRHMRLVPCCRCPRGSCHRW